MSCREQDCDEMSENWGGRDERPENGHREYQHGGDEIDRVKQGQEHHQTVEGVDIPPVDREDNDEGEVSDDSDVGRDEK